MVEVVTDDKWRLPIGDYLKERCYISADIGDKFSYIGFIEDEKIYKQKEDLISYKK